MLTSILAGFLGFLSGFIVGYFLKTSSRLSYDRPQSKTKKVRFSHKEAVEDDIPPVQIETSWGDNKIGELHKGD